MQNNLKEKLEEISKKLRYNILVSTSAAGSGHPTSSMSAVELMATLYFGGFLKFNPENPDQINNDRVIFSKGHAAPLLYSLWNVAGQVSDEELLTLRKFGSKLEGHPTPEFKFSEAATGSLGQGLSVGVGMAINSKYLDETNYKTYVLLGDGEIEEGSVWEAAQIASKYKLNNLIGIVDANRLEQVGATIMEWDLETISKRFEAFGWNTLTIQNGNDISEVLSAMELLNFDSDKPTMIVAKTKKGAGISFLENADGWHGKSLNDAELAIALKELGKFDPKLIGTVSKPTQIQNQSLQPRSVTQTPALNLEGNIGVRKAYGEALNLYKKYHQEIVALDAGVKNSTMSQDFEEQNPESFFEMHIAEQNMVGVALGLSLRNKIPFVSTFSAFFTRAFDQIRMSAYSNGNIKFVGSHAGVSIGADGGSQMGLEDISLFRSVLDSVILYPSDPNALVSLMNEAVEHKGNVYIRTTREDTPVIYQPEEKFVIGGSKIIHESVYDQLTIVAAGITVHEALKAYQSLKELNVSVRVVDLYSIKPLDTRTLSKCLRETRGILVVEDHYKEGGIYEAVKSEMGNTKGKIYSLHVSKMPRSGKPNELLDYEEISARFIVNKTIEILGEDIKLNTKL